MGNVLQIMAGVIQDVGTASVLRERLLLLQDQLQLIVQENILLKEENTRLEKEKHKLSEEIARHTQPDQFIEYGGILFRETGGRYSESPYCPSCKILMSSIKPGIPFFCNHCGHSASITPVEIPEIIKKLTP